MQGGGGGHHTVPVVWVPRELALGPINHLGHWHGTCTRPLIHTSCCLLPLDEAKTQNLPSLGGVSAPIRLRRHFPNLSPTETGTSVSLKHLYIFIIGGFAGFSALFLSYKSIFKENDAFSLIVLELIFF